MTDIGKEFMEKTRYKYAKASDQQRGLQQPPLEKDSNPGSAIIELPSPRDLTFDYSLKKAINERESVRKYTDQPLTLEELSWLLWCAQGVKEVTNRRATLRTVPSAGARHAFETYVLVNRVKDLQPGLYRFMAINHKLEEISTDIGLAERLTGACLNQSMVKNSAVTFFWTVMIYRMKWRYGER
ncbi:MAG: SagB/ThcOx family dehydrogenase, partial [Candidatus Hodarchaeales archaeon]